jgi:hypothetical protein
VLLLVLAPGLRYDSSIAEERMVALLVLNFLNLWAFPAPPVVQSEHAAPSKSASLAGDPYAPLRLYDGKWDLVPAHSDKPAETMHIENHCAKVGEFFACNQFVNNKNMALVIFLPQHPLQNGGYAYRNQALRVEGDNAGAWGALEITGDRWVYSSDETDKGKKIYWRTNNMFSGSDKIHFEVQRSEDEVNWTTTMSGDEARVK